MVRPAPLQQGTLNVPAPGKDTVEKRRLYLAGCKGKIRWQHIGVMFKGIVFSPGKGKKRAGQGKESCFDPYRTEIKVDLTQAISYPDGMGWLIKPEVELVEP